ncbi:MAG: hypothetical protein Q4Q10_00890 [Eubacteriales bacterium]|nr:hypothetical protein [Eubacteriales bacterium]
MTGKEFEQIIRISFERKKFTNLIIDKKLFRNFAHVYCKSAVHPGKFHYTCTMSDMRDKPTLEVQQADVDLAVWDDQDARAWNAGLFPGLPGGAILRCSRRHRKYSGLPECR